MPAELIDFFNIVFRFIHIIAAIMWIGNSLLFTWMEINLIPDPDKPHSLGHMNMLHGGGVFFLEKRVIDPQAIPPHLHRFLWQSYTTWISGFILLVSVFYSRSGSLIIDPSKSSLSGTHGVLISLASLIGGWIAYDLFWKSPIKHKPILGTIIGSAVLLAFAAWLDTLFNSRFTYLQIGAMLGTTMSANVFFHIIPGQRKMMEALLAGKEHDLELGRQSKIRSRMNHYVTFPVIFLMLSAHFPILYGAQYNIAIMGIISVCLIIIKHLMNTYHQDPHWLKALLGTFAFGSCTVAALIALPQQLTPPSDDPAQVMAIAGSKLFSTKGCNACHQGADSAIAPTLKGIFGKTATLTDGSQVLVDEAYLRRSIMEPNAQVVQGYAPAMPNISSTLSPQEVNQLVAYIQSL